MIFEDRDINLRLYKGYTLQRTNPYGLWIVLDSKSKPVFEGAYTTVVDAGNALDNYLTNREKAASIKRV